MLANICVSYVANVLLATVVQFHQVLMLWCAFGLCVIKWAVFTVFLQFPVQKVVQDEEVVVKKNVIT